MVKAYSAWASKASRGSNLYNQRSLVYSGFMDDLTIAFMTIFTGVVCTILLMVNTRTKVGQRSSLLWSWGAAIYTLGITLLAVQPSMPAILGIMASNLSIVAGTILICLGSLDFWGEDLRVKLHIALFAAFSVLVSIFTFAVPSVLARIVIISFLGSYFCVEIAATMFRNGRKLDPVIPYFIGGIFVLLAVFFVGRGVWSLITGANVLFANRLVSNAMFIILDFSMLGWSLGYIMLQNLKLQKNLSELNEELEARVRARTAELESSNRELESFAYAISHDLRTPLRAMEGFGTLLKLKAEECMDKDGLHFADRVCESARHMGQLIDKLLELSRVGRSHLRLEEFDLGVLAEEIAARFKEEFSGRQLSFSIQKKMKIKADRAYVSMLLSNLVDNAVKFSQGKAEVLIEIGSDRAEGEGKPAYFVKDNGVGFDMSYADKLFSPFQHLHSPDEYPGLGVGLVTSARIVDKHGGRIWATAVPGQGACFYFTLGAA
jgi:signal transduction histidine kinase